MNTPVAKKPTLQKPQPPPTIPQRLEALEKGMMSLDRITIPRLVLATNDELAKLDRNITVNRRDLSGLMEVVDTLVGLAGDGVVAAELQNRRIRRAMDQDQRLQELIIADLEAGKLEAEATARAATAPTPEGQVADPGSLIVTQEFAEGSDEPLPGSYSARFMRDSIPEFVTAFTDKAPGTEILLPLKKNGQPVLDEENKPRQNRIVLLAVYKQKALPPESTEPVADPSAPVTPPTPEAPEAAQAPEAEAQPEAAPVAEEAAQ